MRLLSATRGTFRLILDPREQICLINALSELCDTPLEVPNFPTTVGVSRHAAEQLLEAIHTAYDRSRPVEVDLAAKDLRALHNAMQIVLDQIEDWEFGIRLGVSRDECSEVMRSLDEVRSHAAEP
jgi:hypothetical protein